jgi:hypothetical protein
MMDNLRDTIAPKSDQLNADDLIGTTKTITVTAVTRGEPDQPVCVDYDGSQGRPYKPCKSMRRLLIAAWGDDGRAWSGKRMTLYCDPEVKFGGVKVGGIRISHLSDIAADMTVALTVTRGRRAPYLVRKLVDDAPQTLSDDQITHIQDLCAEVGVEVSAICAAYKVASLADVNAKQYTSIVKRLESKRQ